MTEQPVQPTHQVQFSAITVDHPMQVPQACAQLAQQGFDILSSFTYMLDVDPQSGLALPRPKQTIWVIARRIVPVEQVQQ